MTEAAIFWSTFSSASQSPRARWPPPSAVKTVANALVQHGAANGYQRVYGELYRRYSISSYKSLPRRRFQEALDWLRGWYQEVEREGARS